MRNSLFCFGPFFGIPSLDKYFAKQMEKAHVIGLQAASIQDGELVWQGSYGLKAYQIMPR